MVVVPLLPAGVPALTAEVVSDAPEKVGVLTVPAGVIVELPPVPPTSPLAAMVPSRNWPFRAVTSVNELGQVPLRIMIMAPEGKGITPVGIRLGSIRPVLSVCTAPIAATSDCRMA